MIRKTLLAAGILIPALGNAGALYFYEMSNASESGYGGAGLATALLVLLIL